MMLLGIYKNNEGKTFTNLYYNWDLWFKDTFSPTTEIVAKLLFKIEGKTYMKKKENLRHIAIYFSCLDTITLSYRELAEINSFFEKNAKRYGLLKEFRENGII